VVLSRISAVHANATLEVGYPWPNRSIRHVSIVRARLAIIAFAPFSVGAQRMLGEHDPDKPLKVLEWTVAETVAEHQLIRPEAEAAQA
jgi:hypothetical protein